MTETTQASPAPKPSSNDEKQKRLSDALRKNLMRRKAAANAKDDA